MNPPTQSPVEMCRRVLELDRLATKDWKALRAPDGYPSDVMFIYDKNGDGQQVARLQADYNNVLAIEEFRTLAPAIARELIKYHDALYNIAYGIETEAYTAREMLSVVHVLAKEALEHSP